MNLRHSRPNAHLRTVAAILFGATLLPAQELREFDVPPGSRPHDVAPAPDGTVWYTAQGLGALGSLDPATGKTVHIPLGEGSRPHGVIIGPDGAPWITDGGLNAIVTVDPRTHKVTTFPMPAYIGYTNLNTSAFGGDGQLWFTGQSGIYGSLNISTGDITVHKAPRKRGPYGICATPNGDIYYVSLAGSYLGRVDLATGAVEVIDPPTLSQGARRVWSDSKGNLWISEWKGKRVARYTPSTRTWREWIMPADNSKPYSIYVDEQDIVWLSDFGSNSFVRFDPATETFSSYPLPSKGAAVRQMLGRPGELWGGESGVDKLVVLTTP